MSNGQASNDQRTASTKSLYDRIHKAERERSPEDQSLIDVMAQAIQQAERERDEARAIVTDKTETLLRAEAALRKIASTDYRGNEPTERRIAREGGWG